MYDYASIWREVSAWPPEQRLALATRLLESVERHRELAAAPKERQEALRQLIGIWKTEQPPSDAEVEQILEQERLKKYA